MIVVAPTRGDVVAALLGGGLHLGEAQAIARGDVVAVAPDLLALRASGLWLSDDLIARVLSSVGEGARG